MRHIPAGGRWPGGTLWLPLPRPRPCALAGPAAAASTAIVRMTLEALILGSSSKCLAVRGETTLHRARGVPSALAAIANESRSRTMTSTAELRAISAVRRHREGTIARPARGTPRIELVDRRLTLRRL